MSGLPIYDITHAALTDENLRIDAKCCYQTLLCVYLLNSSTKISWDQFNLRFRNDDRTRTALKQLEKQGYVFQNEYFITPLFPMLPGRPHE